MKKYSDEFKNEIIEFAKTFSVGDAKRKYGVDWSTIVKWMDPSKHIPKIDPNAYLYDSDIKLVEYIKSVDQFRGLKKTSPLTLRITQYVKDHNLYSEETTIQTYIHYIRNDIAVIPTCKLCKNIIPNLALGADRVQTFCSKTCQGINQRGDNYKSQPNYLITSDIDLYRIISNRKRFGGIIKSENFESRVRRYIIDNTKINESSLSFNECLHVVKRNLVEYPKCINCGKQVKIVPLYNTSLHVEKVSGRDNYQSFCIECAKITSSYEHDIRNFLTRNNVQYVSNDRTLLGNNQEIDIYIPNSKVAIEINGLRWHAEKDKNYHLNKTKICEQNGIKLIHIFSDELDSKKDIVYSRIKSILGLVKYKIGARECTAQEISIEEKGKFLDKYHIQGNDKSQVHVGLFYRTRLVSVMTFGCPRIVTGHNQKESTDEYELVRFVSIKSVQIYGAASKLFSFFVKQYKPKKVHSYADRRWSQGKVYNNMGFIQVSEGVPNYWYILNPDYNKRYHRFDYRKNVLVNKLEKFDENLSESENMKNNKHFQIYDCGSLKFEWSEPK